MKNLKLFLIAIVLFSINATAKNVISNNRDKPTNPVTTQLRNEIVKLIGDNCPYDYHKNECTAEVLFTINTKGEIIVISVDSPNTLAEAYIKSKLNYKKTNYMPSQEGKIFLLPLRMVK